MKKQQNRGCGDKMIKNRQTVSTPIHSLINDLASDDGVIRVKARRELVSLGNKSVKPLIKALAASNQWVRWEAAKALGQIGNPAAKDALIQALEDKIFDVRWLAAEGLIAIGPEVIEPILLALIKRADSVWVREGAHHVLHDLATEEFENILHPVLAALEDAEASVTVSFVARSARNALKK